MSIFAPNEPVAKSRFWYFLSQLKKMKKTTGQIVNIKEVRSGGKGRRCCMSRLGLAEGSRDGVMSRNLT
jgi:hypothetical protein